jgi:putative hydrolase of the HAD superfamily
MPASSLESVVAVTLDAEGTLVHPYPSVGEVYSEVLEGHGISVDSDCLEESFRQAFETAKSGRSAEVNDQSELRFWRRVVREALEGHCSHNQFEPVFDDLYREFGSARRWKLDKDALPTIQSLKRKGFVVGVLSNWDSRLGQVLRELKVEPLLDACFISCEIGFEKPDPRIFRHVEDALGLEPSQILHVGNSLEHDAEGARNAGWNYLLVQNSKAVSAHDSHMIQGLTEILKVLC